MKTQMHMQLGVEIIKQGKVYIAYARALDLSTCAKTQRAAKKNFEEIVEIFIDELVEKGTLESVLNDLGWKKIKKQWEPPKVVSFSKIDLPLPVSV